MFDDSLADPSQLFVLIAILNGLAIARLFERVPVPLDVGSGGHGVARRWMVLLGVVSAVLC